MSIEDDTFSMPTRNVALIDLNDVGAENKLLIQIHIARVGEDKIKYKLVRSDDTQLGGHGECKTTELYQHLTGKKRLIVNMIMEAVHGVTLDGGDIPEQTLQRIKQGVNGVLNVWTTEIYKEEVDIVIEDSVIDPEIYDLHRTDALEEAEKIVISPEPMKAVLKHLDNIIAGEETNKQIVFLLGLTGLEKDPSKKTIVCALHDAGAGKTWTLKNIASFFRTHTVSHLSKKALNHMGKQLRGEVDDEGKDIPNSKDWKHKQILFLKELGMIDKEDSSEGNAAIKMLSPDDGGITTSYTVKDEDTMEFKTITRKTDPLTIFTSSTRAMGSIDAQFVRRYWIFSPDASEKQTIEIIRFKVKNKLQENLVNLNVLEYTDMDWSRWVLKALVELIEENMNVPILNPLNESIFDILETTNLRVRGDIDKVALLIEMYARLHYRKLHRLEINGTTNYLIDPKHVIEILQMARQMLVFMSHGTEGRVYELLEIIKDMKFEEVGGKANRITIGRKEQEDIAIAFGGKNIKSIQKYFRTLPSEFVDEDKVGSNTVVFYLNMPPDQILRELSGYKDLDDVDLINRLYQKMIEEGNEFFEMIGSDYRYIYDGDFIANIVTSIIRE